MLVRSTPRERAEMLGFDQFIFVAQSCVVGSIFIFFVGVYLMRGPVAQFG